MAVKILKPTTPGRRGASVVDYSNIDQVEPCARLTVALKKHSGRNNTGRITVRHQGGGVRRHYRLIDWRRDKRDVPGKVEFIEYDPNRTAFIARIVYADGDRRYILAPEGLKKGATIVAADSADVQVGNAMPLRAIPRGTFVHNIEMRPGKGGQMVRSAGMVARLVAKEGDYATILLPSTEMRMVPLKCRATLGTIGNLDHINVRIGKAGRSRWLGIRPWSRGSAQNPIAHPMGGGEGRNSGGRHPCSPRGVLSKGGRTRNRKKASGKAIIRRRISVRYGEVKL